LKRPQLRKLHPTQHAQPPRILHPSWPGLPASPERPPEEQERKEQTEEARAEWLNNMWTGGFFPSIAYRKFQLANNQDKELKLQDPGSAG